MDHVYLSPGDPRYLEELSSCLGDEAPHNVVGLGNLELLGNRKLALFCSVKCPGKLILRGYDLVHRLRLAGVTTIGGFHSPMEREWLGVLLGGKQPVILCMARSLTTMRVPVPYRVPLQQGRLLLISCFDEEHLRITVETAVMRNRFVAAMAEAVLVAYAEPGGKTEQFCREVLAWGKPLYTLGSDSNANLLEMGATPAEGIPLEWLAGPPAEPPPWDHRPR